MKPPDKRARAVALTYEAEDGAPRVVAKGKGLLAEEIIERAKAAGVFVHESPDLVNLLMQVDLDERIPPRALRRGGGTPGLAVSARARRAARGGARR